MLRHHPTTAEELSGVIGASIDRRASAVSTRTTFRLVYRQSTKKGVEVETHPALDILSNGVTLYDEHRIEWPNFPWATALELGQKYIDIKGATYFWVQRGSLGEPVGLRMLNGFFVSTMLMQGQLAFSYAGHIIPFKDMMVIYQANPQIPMLARGILTANEAIAITMTSLEQFQSNLLQRGGVPPIYGSVDEDVDDPDDLKALSESFSRDFRGVENAGKIPFFDKNTSLKPLGFNPNDLGMNGIKTGNREDVQIIFGVPDSVLGLAKEISRANADATIYSFLSNIVQPLATRWAVALTAFARREFDQKLLWQAFVNIPEDELLVSQAMAERIKAGVTSIDQEREARGDAPYNLPETRVPLVSQNLVPVDQLNKVVEIRNMQSVSPDLRQNSSTIPRPPSNEPPPPKPPKKSADTDKRIAAGMQGYRDGAAKKHATKWSVIFRAQKKMVLDKLEHVNLSSLGDGETKDVHTTAALAVGMMFDEKFWNDYVRERMSSAYRGTANGAYREMIDLMGALMPRSLSVNTSGVERQIDGVNATTRDDLIAIMVSMMNGTKEQIATAVTDKFSDYADSRASRIGDSEATALTNAGSTRAIRDTGYTRKQWVSMDDNRVRETHQVLDGQTVEVDEPFVSPSGAQLMFPGDPAAPPDETINCRCLIVGV